MSLSASDVKWLFEKLRKLDFLSYHSEEELTKLVLSIKKNSFSAGKPSCARVRKAKRSTSYGMEGLRSGLILPKGATASPSLGKARISERYPY